MQTVLITGVSSGTGLGLVNQFISKGHRVIGSVRSNDKASELKKRFGSRFTPLVFDITKPKEIEAEYARLKHDHGIKSLSAIINNAGCAEIGPVLHVPAEEFIQHLNVLVVGQLSVIQRFYKLLIPSDLSQPVGKIYNITSISGTGSNYLFGCYSSGKHAFEGLSKTLREECEIYGIKVIVVAPGNIATAIWDKQTEEMADKYRDTDYYSSLKFKLKDISSNAVKNAMSVDEFSTTFYNIFNDESSANRYTIIKSKNTRIPFGKMKVRVMKS